VTLVPPLVRGAWVRPGGGTFPDQQKARGFGVDQFFWDATDPAADHPKKLPGVLDDMRKAGWKVGITRDPQWDGYSHPFGWYGAQLSKDITDLGCDGKQCSAVLDGEVHDSNRILAELKAFRKLRPGRFLYWTMEPKQGGIMSDELIAWINNDPLTWVVIQKYRNRMQPVSERAVIDDLRARGLREDKILVYYERYEEGFEGIIFDIANAA
jgi:hypothetical protein